MAPARRIQEAAAAILAGGHTLRLVVDGRRRDVLVPRRIRAEHGAQLIIDLGEQQRRTVIGHEAAICNACVGDAAGLVAGRGHASSLAMGLAAAGDGLPSAQSRGIFLAAAHLAGDDLDALGDVLDRADLDDPETTLAIVALVPPAQRDAPLRMREAEACVALGRGADARAVLEATVLAATDPAGSLARDLGLLRAELANGVDRARAESIRDAAIVLGESLPRLADGTRAALVREHVRTVVDACLAAGDAATALRLVDQSLAFAPDDLGSLEQRLAALTALRDERHHALRAELLARVDPDGARARRIRATQAGWTSR